jgi:hypothetical protein
MFDNLKLSHLSRLEVPCPLQLVDHHVDGRLRLACAAYWVLAPADGAPRVRVPITPPASDTGSIGNRCTLRERPFIVPWDPLGNIRVLGRGGRRALNLCGRLCRAAPRTRRVIVLLDRVTGPARGARRARLAAYVSFSAHARGSRDAWCARLARQDLDFNFARLALQGACEGCV